MVQRRNPLEDAREGMKFYESLTVSSGFPDLDAATGGLAAGALWVVDGQPAAARTRLLYYLAGWMAGWGKRVMMISPATREPLAYVSAIAAATRRSADSLAHDLRTETSRGRVTTRLCEDIQLDVLGPERAMAPQITEAIGRRPAEVIIIHDADLLDRPCLDALDTGGMSRASDHILGSAHALSRRFEAFVAVNARSRSVTDCDNTFLRGDDVRLSLERATDEKWPADATIAVDSARRGRHRLTYLPNGHLTRDQDYPWEASPAQTMNAAGGNRFARATLGEQVLAEMRASATPLQPVGPGSDDQPEVVRFVALINDISLEFTKAGDEWAQLTLEHAGGPITGQLFPTAYRVCGEFLRQGMSVNVLATKWDEQRRLAMILSLDPL